MGRMPHVYLIRHGKSLSVSTTGYCIRLLTYVATDYFLLVKIGQTEWSVNGRHTGTSDIPLTEQGIETMKRTADLVVPDVIDPSNVAHIYVSPRQRAQKTAELLFHDNPKITSPIPFETTEEIAEWDYGAYEGLVTKEIKEKKKDWWIWTDGCPPSEEHPGGESPQEMEKRVDGFIAKIRARHRECYEKGEDAKDIVVVSHGHFSRCFIVRWCGWPLETGYHISADAGALSILGYQHHNLDEPSLIALNWFSADRA